MKTLFVALIVTNMLSLTALYWTDGGSCRELVDMHTAELRKQAEAEQKMHDLLTNNGKPVPFPKFEDRGL